MHDLRSDTVTVPTPAMRAAMAEAAVGDDVFGEDPTVAELERAGAALLDKPAALFVPSGTMGNQLCLGVLAPQGSEIIAEASAHVLLNEAGAAARLWGCQIRPVAGTRGAMDPAAVEALIREDDIHYPRTGLISVEQSHNYAGGAALPLEHLDALAELARRRGLPLHMDGARLFNAAVALEVPAARLVRDVDMVSVCLSKGLGAPVGSLVVGGAEPVAAARRLRKLLGGGMRQAGVIAAAGLLALTEGPGRLAEDHARAAALARGLDELPGFSVDLPSVQTNIVFVTTERPAAEVERALAERDVAAIALGADRLRFVFHRDVGDEALEAALAACRDLAGD